MESLEGRSLFAATVVDAAPVALSPGTVTGPAPVTTSGAPTFTWSAVSGVDGYQVHIYDKAAHTDLSVNVGGTTTHYTPASGALHPGGQYVWDVRDIVGSTATRLVSGRLNFAIPSLARPTSLSPGSSTGPAQGLNTVNPTFTWSAVAGVNGYQLRVYDKVDHAVYSVNVGASTTSYTPAAGTLRPGDRFVWNVRDVTGSKAVWIVSGQLDFSLPGLPAPTVIGPGLPGATGPIIATETPTFTWDPVTSITGFSGYQVNLFDQTAHTAATYTASASATAYTVPAGKLISGHAYVWSLRLRDGSLTSLGASDPFLHFRIHVSLTPAVTV